MVDFRCIWLTEGLTFVFLDNVSTSTKLNLWVCDCVLLIYFKIMSLNFSHFFFILETMGLSGAFHNKLSSLLGNTDALELQPLHSLLLFLQSQPTANTLRVLKNWESTAVQDNCSRFRSSWQWHSQIFSVLTCFIKCKSWDWGDDLGV